MKAPYIFDNPEIWEKYLRGCNNTEVEELIIAIHEIGEIARKLMIEELEKKIKK